MSIKALQPNKPFVLPIPEGKAWDGQVEHFRRLIVGKKYVRIYHDIDHFYKKFGLDALHKLVAVINKEWMPWTASMHEDAVDLMAERVKAAVFSCQKADFKGKKTGRPLAELEEKQRQVHEDVVGRKQYGIARSP